MTTPCEIVSVGKRRDGGTKYWCLEHKADATAKYGTKAKKCRYAHIEKPTKKETLRLDPTSYAGGVALWGAVPPIFDTTKLAIDRGIHVHARSQINGHKDIDWTYRSVVLSNPSGASSRETTLTELDAIYFMVSSVFGFSTKLVTCTHCGYPHLDKDWFSVHVHQKHLCSGCGKTFRDVEVSVGNPVADVQAQFPGAKRVSKPAQGTLNIKQADYPGGIQIWGSNPAFLWTSAKTEDEGIHVHAFKAHRETCSDDDVDDTYKSVTIDDIKLDPAMVRVFMAQSALPHIAGRVIGLRCPKCKKEHFDSGELAYTPHDDHVCHYCEAEFPSSGRFRKVISNPMVFAILQLTANSYRTPQRHDLGLLPETI